jgi:hypothetical protein
MTSPAETDDESQTYDGRREAAFIRGDEFDDSDPDKGGWPSASAARPPDGTDPDEPGETRCPARPRPRLTRAASPSWSA